MLKKLHIENFRSLENFDVPKLGRVNLIVGKNNSGKSTVLEALRIYAGHGNRALLESISSEHDERVKASDSDFPDSPESLPFSAFFSGRMYPPEDDSQIIIGESKDHPEALRIRHGFLIASEESTLEPGGEAFIRIVRREVKKTDLANYSEEDISQALMISKGDRGYRLRFDMSPSRLRPSPNEMGPGSPCGYVPTRFVTISELADEWDKIVLTDYEQIAIEALKLINADLLSLAFVNSEELTPPPRRQPLRIAKVKLSRFLYPVPLNSMGDGMLRILQLVLKVFSARGGLLLIDEFENGLHYSVQEQVWELLFDLAASLDIQVFATTHSWDCIESFSKVANARKSTEGILFRVGTSVRTSDFGKVIATVFDEDALSNITQADVEVR